MPKKNAKRRGKKLTLTLSERDAAALVRYATQHKLTRAVAARRMIHEALASWHETADAEPHNQLGLFDSIQIDIFNQTHKPTLDA